LKHESLPHPSSRLPEATKRHYFFFAARNFAQRARVAAAILFLPAAEIFRVGFTAEAVAPAACNPFRAFAQRAFCARLMRLRAEADRVRPALV
jgi:hypothetical protein